MIRIRDLHKFFNQGRQNELHVLNDISLDLPSKGMVAIFGKSGCGKTTLLNVIGGLDGFARGEVTIEDKSIRENTDVIRNQYIGYIFQSYNLNKNESCFDNVADALRLCGIDDEEEIRTRVMAALRNVGMQNYAKRPPDTLSGGQQQRIAIARAIVKNPPIILADEPTGNLDEANTVLIMDLLKAISRDRLVILVTHEANLVDFYCDTVIELQDGKIVGNRQNVDANGFAARDKNAIYLGELGCQKIAGDGAEIEYYGAPTEEPVRLKIINNGGKLYIRVESEKVHVLDESSEIRLLEGVYQEKERPQGIEQRIDMSDLPPIQGKQFGKLFHWRSAIKSGYAANFKRKTKGNKMLRTCMGLFAAVVVFMSSIFGSAFGDLLEAKNACHPGVFYVYTPNASVSARLNEAVGREETGIDFVRLMNRVPYGSESLYFRSGSFETFAPYDYEDNLHANAIYLDVALAEGFDVVEGRREMRGAEEILISTQVADALLDQSTLGYMDEYRDLIGLVSNQLSVDGKSLRVVGIVDTDEPAIYLSAVALAKYVRQSGNLSHTVLATDFGVAVAPGEAILAIRNARTDVSYPRVGETVQIQGRDIRVSAVKTFYSDYSLWLEANGIAKQDAYDFFLAQLQSENPELAEDEDQLHLAAERACEERRYEYYDYYYSDFDAFLEDFYLFESDLFELWLYVRKGIELAKFAFLPEDYYKASAYKALYGSYPTPGQQYGDLPDLYEELAVYEAEFYSSDYVSYFNVDFYLVSEQDYIAFSKQVGTTHPTATDSNAGLEYEKAEPEAYSMSEKVLPEIYDTDIESGYYYGNVCYTLIHSVDPRQTEAWLADAFPELEGPTDEWGAIIMPDMVFKNTVQNHLPSIIGNLITLAVMLALMSVCMYFMMRASLMNRIKEIGICRAIGVSGRNVAFEFLIEAAVLTTLTVLVGYLLTSGFLALCFGMSSVVSEILYYPVWLAGAVLAVLYLNSLLFGVLPVLSLLRKTPSEILAKYDI